MTARRWLVPLSAATAVLLADAAAKAWAALAHAAGTAVLRLHRVTNRGAALGVGEAAPGMDPRRWRASPPA